MDGAAGSTAADKADLELVRVCISPEGAFGVLLIDGVPAGPVTLERTYPAVESKPRGPQFVKIPAGVYACKRTVFYRGGYDTYEVSGVIGHDRLLFHRGNAEVDSEGCILIGSRFGYLSMKPCVLGSREGFSEFMRLTWGRPRFSLAIRNAA